MKVWYDCEFIERGNGTPIIPISLGFVREDGAELYVIDAGSLAGVMIHPWLSVNVAPRLPIRSDNSQTHEWDPNHDEYPYVLDRHDLVQRVHNFLTEHGPVTELWTYYGAYDHVVLCQLFGTMNELPSGIPMWSHDIMQLHEWYPEVGLPPQPPVDHHAMWDARWNYEAYQRFTSLLPKPKPALEVVDAEVVDGD